MQIDPRTDALTIATRAIARCSGTNLIQKSTTLADGVLTLKGIDDEVTLELDTFDRILIASSGKAAVSTAKALCQILTGKVTAALSVTKDEPLLNLPTPLEAVLGNHPIPGPDSITAGTKMLEFAQQAMGGDLVIYVLSGGTSALLEAPRHGITLEDIRQETRKLLLEGATINELNTVRKRMSRIKAGGLAEAFEPATVIVLVISDVQGDDFSIIGSGPFYSENPYNHPTHLLMANAKTLQEAATEEAFALGYDVVIEEKFVTGEARFRGVELAQIASDSVESPTVTIAVGEPTVTVRGNGLGGRCQEAALAAAIELNKVQSQGVVLCIGSDGTDGPTLAAGAVVDRNTITNIIKAEQALKANDSLDFHAQAGSLIELEEATGTNLNDLFLAISVPKN